MLVSESNLKRIIKKYLNKVSPIGIGRPETPDEAAGFFDPAILGEDVPDFYDIKLQVFKHLQAMGSIDIEEEPGGFAWEELNVWQIPDHTRTDSREFIGSILHKGKRYYGEW